MTTAEPIFHIDPLEILGAPAVSIDVAAIAAEVLAHAPATTANPPPLTAIEMEALAHAREVGAYRADPGGYRSSELLEVTCREIDRQMWWRDRAEGRAEELRQQLAALTRETVKLREQRRDALAILFELVAWCALRLGCSGSAKEVLARIRGERLAPPSRAMHG